MAHLIKLHLVYQRVTGSIPNGGNMPGFWMIPGGGGFGVGATDSLSPSKTN